MDIQNKPAIRAQDISERAMEMLQELEDQRARMEVDLINIVHKP
jgi:hypothetical protein